MKVAPFAFSFLLFAFITTTKLPLAFSDDFKPVIDTSNFTVFSDEEYFVSAIGGGHGGGLILAKTGHSTCPVTVLLDHRAPISGVRFRSPLKQVILLTDSPLDIEVAVKPDCVESSKWIVFYDYDIEKACVGIGGPQDHPGKKIMSGQFQIKGSGPYDYKFVFCVSGSPVCLDVGNYDNGESGDRLILTQQDQHLLIGFMQTWNGIRSAV